MEENALRHAVFEDPDFFLLVALPASGAVLVTGLDLGLGKFSGTGHGKGKVDGRVCAQCSEPTLKRPVV